MIVAEQSETIRSRSGSRLSLVDSMGNDSPTVSTGSSSRIRSRTSGITPDVLPEQLSIIDDSGRTSEATGQSNGNQSTANSKPKLYAVIVAFVIGAYFFFK